MIAAVLFIAEGKQVQVFLHDSRIHLFLQRSKERLGVHAVVKPRHQAVPVRVGKQEILQGQVAPDRSNRLQTDIINISGRSRVQLVTEGIAIQEIAATEILGGQAAGDRQQSQAEKQLSHDYFPDLKISFTKVR